MAWKLEDISPAVRHRIRANDGKPIPGISGLPIPEPAKALPSIIRQKTGPSLNKTEKSFLVRLNAVYGPERVLSQSITLQIANGCTFRPDFIVVQGMDGSDLWSMMAFEVKGPYVWDDAKVKLKVAARMYPWIKFYLASRDGLGGWRETRVLA